MTNTKISLIERVKRWKKSNIVFAVGLFLLMFDVLKDNINILSFGHILPIVFAAVVFTLLYSIMIIIIDIATSKTSEVLVKTNEVLDKRASIKKEQKEAEKKEERQKVENIDLDL